MAPRFTAAQKLLVAAAALEGRGKAPFTAEDLVVESHREFPETFSLKGYPDVPDSNRVFVEMMGQKPLKKNGWLRRVGPKNYRLTEAGRIAALGLKPSPSQIPARALSLSRTQSAVLDSLLGSRASRKVSRGETEDLIFQDACAFWDITVRTVASTLSDKLASTESILSLAEKETKGDGEVQLASGHTMGRRTVDHLRSTHETLKQRFARELAIIGSRRDDRSPTGKTQKTS